MTANNTKRGRVFYSTISGAQNAFVWRALDSIPGVTSSTIIRKLLLKWAEGVLGETAPEGPIAKFGAGRPALPNGLTAQARRLGIKPKELRKRLLREALDKLAQEQQAAE